MMHHDFAQLKETFTRVYALHQWGNQQYLIPLLRDWPQIAGKQVAQLTRPAFFRKDVLWIYVQNSAWMQHVQYVKLDLLQRINDALATPTITDIRWLLQPVSDQEPPERRKRPLKPIDPDQRQRFNMMTASIGDTQCQAALQRLWQAFQEQGE